MKKSTSFQKYVNEKKLKKNPTSTVEDRVYRTMLKYKDEFKDDITRSKPTPD